MPEELPIQLMNRKNADELRMLLIERTFHWNQMRRTQISYNAVPASKHNKNIIDDEKITSELEDEILSAFKWWIIDDLYYYMSECTNDMGIGVYVDIDYTTATKPKDVIRREHNKLNIHLSNYLLLLAQTPAVYNISTEERSWEFFLDTVETIYAYLKEDGFEIRTRTSQDQHMKGTDVILNGMKELGCVRLTISWADANYADAIEQLEYESQLDAYKMGVPLDDILA